MGLWIGTIIAFGAAAFLAYLAYKAKQRHHEMVTTETFSVQELTDLSGAASKAAGSGFFQQKGEVVGEAEPGPDGLLTSELSETECVWHKHVITRKYWETERRRSGGSYRTRRVRKKEVVAEHATANAFSLKDDTGSIVVQPQTDAMEHMEKIVDRFEQHHDDRGNTELSIGNFNLKIPRKNDEGTIGFQEEEWILRQGTQLYVLGEIGDPDGSLTVTNPSLISTKNEQTLLHETNKRQKLMTVLAVLTCVVGITLAVIAIAR